MKDLNLADKIQLTICMSQKDKDIIATLATEVLVFLKQRAEEYSLIFGDCERSKGVKQFVELIEQQLQGNIMNRVIVSEDGEASSPERAMAKGIKADIAFKRKDGWILGAPKQFESIAHSMWEDQWVSFAWIGDGPIVWLPYSQYK